MKKELIDINDFKTQVDRLRSLNEWVDRNTVANAIQNKDVVFIYYAGDETVNRGYRTIEPYVLGTSTAGNLVLRAWQQAGATDSGNPASRPNDEIPGWRLFRLDGITSMAKTLKKFETDPAYMQTNRPNYNPQDKQMTQVILAVQPTGEEPQTVDGDKSITQPNTYQGMTNDKNWFQTQYNKFKNVFTGKKQQDPNAGKAWFDQKKREFDNAIKQNKQNSTNQNGV